jgi:hypothetical protein
MAERVRCDSCGKFHRTLDRVITEQDIHDLRDIINHLDCANQAIDACKIDKNATEEQAQRFVQIVLAAKASSMTLEKEWWERATKTYNLPKTGTFTISWEERKFVQTEEE